MTYPAKTGAAREVLFGEVVAANTRWVSRKRSDLDLLGRDPMANIAGDFGMLASLMCEGSALAGSLRSPGLWPIGLRSLQIERSGVFRVRRQTEVSSGHKQARQSELAVHHRYEFPVQPGRGQYLRRGYGDTAPT